MSYFFIDKLDITAGTAAASKALVLDASKDIGTIRNLTIDGTFSDGNYTFDTSGNVTGLGTVNCGAITSSGNLAVTGTITGDTSLTLDTTTITTAEIGVLDSVTAGTAAASKALVLDASKDIGTIRNLTIDGTFSDGNYTFDTSGNVTGLGTVGCGAITTTGDIILNDGGSLKEAGGTAAFTFDGSGHVTKIGQDSPTDGQFLKWDNSNNRVVWDSTVSLSASNIFTGTVNEFQNKLIIDKPAANRTIETDGSHLHIDGGININDATTSSGTASSNYNQVTIEAVTLIADASITTTEASTLYISGATAAGTNQTITNAYSLFVDGGACRFDGFIINTYDTVTYGSNSGNITATSADGTIRDPTASSVFLQAVTSSTDTTYHWNLSSFNGGGNGTTLHLVFDKEDDTGITALQVNFGSNKLYSGNGKNDSLTFSTSGQSASLIYMDSAWRIINTGATIGNH